MSGRLFGRSALLVVLENWRHGGGELAQKLEALADVTVETVREVEAVTAVLDCLYSGRHRLQPSQVDQAVSILAGFFHHAGNEEVYAAFRHTGLPALRRWAGAALREPTRLTEDVLLVVLRVLAIYQQCEDVALIVRAVYRPVLPESRLWSSILGQFDAAGCCTRQLLEALSEPLPEGFVAAAFLDMVNGLWLSSADCGNISDRHPFDTPRGRAALERWLVEPDAGDFSCARSAAIALAFIDRQAARRLLPTALAHADAGVRLEAAWAQVRTGDQAGLIRLEDFCLDPRYSGQAQACLEALGQADRVPERAREADFVALVEMAGWLAHPHEYGRPPDEIELYDTRELYWPPTDDRRRLWLVSYGYRDMAEHGIGLVGSTTFALFDQKTAEYSAAALYGLYCCWELELNRDSRFPGQCSAEAGMEILERYNPAQC